MPAEPGEKRRGARFAVSELVVGLGLLALAAIVAFDASRLPAGALYGVGPGAPAMIVAAGLCLLGLATLVAAWRRAETAPPVDAGPVLMILFGLALLILVVALGGGFVPAFTILFAATARAFGSRAPHWDAAIGVSLSLAIYLGFTKLLALSLPQGPLERLF